MVKEFKIVGIILGIAIMVTAVFLVIKSRQSIPRIATQETKNQEENVFSEEKLVSSSFYPGFLCPEETQGGYCTVFVIDRANLNNFQVLGKGYAKDEKRVYLNGRRISDDPKNFQILNEYYSKDSINVYWYGEKIHDANPEKFIVLTQRIAKDDKYLFSENRKNPVDVDTDTFSLLQEGYYSKDKKYVYYGVINGFLILNDADPSTFKVYSAPTYGGNSTFLVATDNKHVFVRNNIIDEVDPSTIVLLKEFYFKDKNNVYYDNKKIPGADPATFEFIYDRYGKDAYNIYMDTRMMPNIDISSFKPIDSNYFKDKYHVYGSNGSIIENVDPDTLTKVSNFFKDKNHVFDYNFESILPYDTQTFKLVSTCDDSYYYVNCWLKDKNGVYFDSKRIDGIDPVSFQILGGNYSKDKDKVYYIEKAIEGADSKTFVSIGNDMAKDNKAIYYGGKIIPNTDIQSFVAFPSYYSKDKNHVYYNFGDYFAVMQNADPDSFTPLSNFVFIAKDFRKVYVFEKSLNYVDGLTFQSIGDSYAKDKKHVYFIQPIDEGED